MYIKKKTQASLKKICLQGILKTGKGSIVCVSRRQRFVIRLCSSAVWLMMLVLFTSCVSHQPELRDQISCNRGDIVRLCYVCVTWVIPSGFLVRATCAVR